MHTVHIKRRILSWVQQQPPLTGAIVAHRQLARLITLQYIPRIFLRNSYSPGLTWGHTTIHTAGGGEEILADSTPPTEIKGGRTADFTPWF